MCTVTMRYCAAYRMTVERQARFDSSQRWFIVAMYSYERIAWTFFGRCASKRRAAAWPRRCFEGILGKAGIRA